MVATWSMLTPRRRRGAGMDALLVHPLRLRHRGLGAQLRQDRGEMLEVIDLEINLHVGEIRRPARHADVVDIAVVLGDYLGDRGERARLVRRLHGDARGEAPWDALFRIPAHIEPALRVILELAQGRRLDRIDGD